MAHEPVYTGWRKYYNSETKLGRATAARLTYGAVALVFVYYKFIKPKPAAPAEKK